MVHIVEIGGKIPEVAPDAFVAPTAVLVGDVTVESQASIWFGTVLRADMNSIRIGSRTSIQDNCVIHTTEARGVEVGSGVTVGHSAVLDSCTVEDGALIGIHSTILDGALIGKNAAVSAGSVVTANTVVAEGVLAAGVPAKVKKELSEESKEVFEAGGNIYVKLAQRYRELGL